MCLRFESRCVQCQDSCWDRSELAPNWQEIVNGEARHNELQQERAWKLFLLFGSCFTNLRRHCSHSSVLICLLNTGGF